jgi:tetratricopeptide (TPR) repeat protein
VLVLIDHARPERLGEVVRALLPFNPKLEVHSEARKLVGVEFNSTVVLIPQAQDADWLNINRPLFAARSLRVVLFCTREMSETLARSAVDFFDWISHRMECPPGPAPFAVEGFRQALAVRAPGIVWRGGELEAAFGVARPRRRLRRVSAARPYEELVAEVQAARGDWLAWTEVDGDFRLRRVRWALAEARRRTRTILVEPAVSSPGWWEVHGRVAEFPEARERLERAGARHPGRLAALVELEPEAIELMVALLERGVSERTLEVEVMKRGADAGAVIGLLAIRHDLVSQRELVRGEAAPPAARAFSRDDSRHRLLDKEVKAVIQRLERGERLEPEEAAWWSASTRAALPFWASGDELGRRGDVAEVLLRHDSRTGSTWGRLAALARLAGDFKVAHGWARRAAELSPDGWRSLAQVLAAQGRWAEAESLLRQHLAADVRTSEVDRGWLLHELGVAHPDYAASQHELARVLERQGKYAEAEGLLRQVLATNEQALGVAHPHYAASLSVLAQVLERQGRYTEAEELLRQSLATQEEALGAASPELCPTLTLLGFTLFRLDRPQEAEPLLRRSIEIALGTWGLHHAETAQALHRLAQVQAALESPDAAATARQAVDTLLQSLGADHPVTQAALPELNRILGASTSQA